MRPKLKATLCAFAFFIAADITPAYSQRSTPVTIVRDRTAVQRIPVRCVAVVALLEERQASCRNLRTGDTLRDEFLPSRPRVPVGFVLVITDITVPVPKRAQERLEYIKLRYTPTRRETGTSDGRRIAELQFFVSDEGRTQSFHNISPILVINAGETIVSTVRTNSPGNIGIGSAFSTILNGYLVRDEDFGF